MTKDQSLMHCTIKKSVTVTKKLAVIGVKLGIALAVLLGLWFAVTSPITTNGFVNITNALCVALASVPWYVYVGIGIPAAIVLYSYFWCVAKTFTKSDWMSDEADASNILSFLISFLTTLILAFTILDMASFDFPRALVIATFLAFLGSAVFTWISFMTENEGELGGIGYYVPRFVGAWRHHNRKNPPETHHDS